MGRKRKSKTLKEEMRRIDKAFNHPFGRYETEFDKETIETSLFFKKNTPYRVKQSVSQQVLNFCSNNPSKCFATIKKEKGEAFFWYEVKDASKVKGIKIESSERII